MTTFPAEKKLLLPTLLAFLLNVQGTLFKNKTEKIASVLTYPRR
jgi:hypothetical protein